MGAPSQKDILTALSDAGNPVPGTTSDDELEVKDEDVESTDVTEDASGTEGIEQDDTDTGDETDAQETETGDEDEDQYLDYTQSGQAKRVNLQDPDDLATIRKSLEKEGLEVTAQRHAEARKKVEQVLEAQQVKLNEYEVLVEQNKQLAPYMKVLENPRAREQIRRAYKLPPVDYNPGLIKEQTENARLRAKDAASTNQQDMVVLGNHIMQEEGMTEKEVRQCVDYMNDNGQGWDMRFTVREQADQIRGLVKMSRKILISEGKLPNPAMEKLEKEKAAADMKLRSARKRAKARNPSAGTGATGAGAGKKRSSLAGASSDDLIAEFKRRSGQ